MSTYSVPAEAFRLLKDGLIDNPLHSSAPPEVREVYNLVEYQGSNDPSVPINWRFAESISAIKGSQACMVNVLLKKKYGISPQKVIINTDHACLIFMSYALSQIDPDGKKITVYNFEEFNKLFPSQMRDPHYRSPHNSACTNIYKTRDGRFYHIHGSLDATQTQAALGIPHVYDVKPGDTVHSIYAEKVAQYDASTLDKLMNDEYRQAGTICQSTEEYLSSEHGKANAHVGLYEVHHIPNPSQKSTWWTMPEGTQPDPSRPLFGLKVVDLTRIIAAPTIGRELAELGASVMRITSPNVSDVQGLNFDLGWGKWSTHLDLKQEGDREKLRALIKECDIVIEGYRPGAMKKWGFGKEDILNMIEGREKGIIYVHENCYGWNGPLSYRSGWQQISDAHCGVSLEYGCAMGHEEAVTPIFPNSDYCTGVAGAIGAIQAIIERGEKGGSFVVDVALNYYSQWLVKTCGTYSLEVWEKVWNKHGRPVFHHKDDMLISMPVGFGLLMKNTPSLFNPSFFETRDNKAIGASVKTVKPIVNFPDGAVKLRFNVGCRPNGVDQPRWPADLRTEIVA
ncbi:CAIB/BAIF family enzyme [Moniliophthora roreri MCA 2997]|uniref:CAIB/BAIF family enzyme n=1 Tax=Moniliophthora roreri (strain MCA 2997) TaxID=1381753 RepID=V2YBU1_MONRO|nr:CAIB/BAIF family enzyme [Moniliophthora roreri MCA 2997]